MEKRDRNISSDWEDGEEKELRQNQHDHSSLRSGQVATPSPKVTNITDKTQITPENKMERKY